jgi:hypothetical protein
MGRENLVKGKIKKRNTVENESINLYILFTLGAA